MQQAPGERGRRRGRGDEPQPPSPQMVMDIFSGLSMRRRVFLLSTVAGCRGAVWDEGSRRERDRGEGFREMQQVQAGWVCFFPQLRNVDAQDGGCLGAIPAARSAARPLFRAV